MPRNMAFSHTTAQFLDGAKTVTRRLGWRDLEPGDVLCAVRKSRGLRKGETVERIGRFAVVSVRSERLDSITAEDVIREGFDMTPEVFVAMFCEMNGCRPDEIVQRIEFVRI